MSNYWDTISEFSNNLSEGERWLIGICFMIIAMIPLRPFIKWFLSKLAILWHRLFYAQNSIPKETIRIVSGIPHKYEWSMGKKGDRPLMHVHGHWYVTNIRT